jgi:uncharacterized membrane protein
MPRITPISTRQMVGRALLVGVAAGLRSMAPLGVFAAERDNASWRAGWKDWPLVSSSAGRAVLQASTVGEMVMDKMPFVPSRIEPGPLGGRLMFGAIAGAAIGTLRPGKGANVLGALAGAAGALAGAKGGHAYRTGVTEATGLPDLPVALVEDLAAVLVARKAIRD